MKKILFAIDIAGVFMATGCASSDPYPAKMNYYDDEVVEEAVEEAVPAEEYYYADSAAAVVDSVAW